MRCDVIARSWPRANGPWRRRPASTVRKPLEPGGFRSVGNHPDPKLMALSCSENAISSGSLSGGCAAGASGSVRA